MTFRRKDRPKGGNGRTSFGKNWVTIGDNEKPRLRTIFKDNKGLYINFNYARLTVLQDEDGSWCA